MKILTDIDTNTGFQPTTDTDTDFSNQYHPISEKLYYILSLCNPDARFSK